MKLRKETFKIGKSYKQASGYVSKIIGTFSESGEIVFVAKTNRPDENYMLYWDNGNCYHFRKDSNSSNSVIRIQDEIKEQ